VRICAIAGDRRDAAVRFRGENCIGRHRGDFENTRQAGSGLDLACLGRRCRRGDDGEMTDGFGGTVLSTDTEHRAATALSRCGGVHR
jgi:hypothetical protein